MKERPILFSAEMVRALLAGRKTQTRRIVKPQGAVLTDDMARALGVRPPTVQNPPVIPCPYGAIGDQLWVKETWATAAEYADRMPTELGEAAPILYRADNAAMQRWEPEQWGKWRPSLFMRRWMSRITLEIVEVRVERLHDITEADAIAEGCDPSPGVLGSDRISFDDCRVRFDVVDGKAVLLKGISRPIMRYRWLWESINGNDSWQDNPFVWVIKFRRVEA